MFAGIGPVKRLSCRSIDVSFESRVRSTGMVPVKRLPPRCRPARLESDVSHDGRSPDNELPKKLSSHSLLRLANESAKGPLNPTRCPAMYSRFRRLPIHAGIG